MTTQESIQVNIHYYKVQLNKARRMMSDTKGEIERMFLNSSIEFYLNQLKDLKQSLKLTINTK